MTEEEKQRAFSAFDKISKAIIITILEAGEDGAPAGPMYASLMNIGFTLEMFESVMSAIKSTGRVKQIGNVYFYVEKEKKEWLNKR